MVSPYTSHLTRQLDGVNTSGRWTPGRKACLVTLIRRGDITIPDACAKYGLSLEEVTGWLKRETAHGTAGLSINRLQELRT